MECGGKQGKACTAKAGYGCAKAEDEISLAGRKKRKKRKKKKKNKNKRFNCLTREKWTEEKTAWCCANEQLGCEVTNPGFNCLTREKWTEEKTAWCCEKEQLGCPVTESYSGTYSVL